MDAPKDLVDSVAAGKVILFAGAGLSSNAGIPLWKDLPGCMISWCEQHGKDIAPDVVAEITTMASRGTDDLLIAAQELRSRMQEPAFAQFMDSMFRNPNSEPTPLHMMLPEAGFAGVLTTNYDSLLETAYTRVLGAMPSVFTQKSVSGLSKAIQGDDFFVLKVHGDATDVETVVWGQRDYRQTMFGATPAYRETLVQIFRSRVVLFLGASLNDPEIRLFLSEARAALRGFGANHYALLDETVVGSVLRRHFENDYNIQLSLYRPSDPSHPEVLEFVSSIKRGVEAWREREKWMLKALLSGKYQRGKRTVRIHWSEFLPPVHRGRLSVDDVGEVDVTDGDIAQAARMGGNPTLVLMDISEIRDIIPVYKIQRFL